MKTSLNPFAPSQSSGRDFELANGAPISQLKFGNRGEYAIGRNGEINASSQVDLLGNIDQLMKAANAGAVRRQAPKLSVEEIEERKAIFASAYNDKSGKEWEMLGAAIADAIKQQGDREGFLRRLVNLQTLNQGEMPRVPMPAHDAVAIVATSSSEVQYQLIRNKVFLPPEFAITANLRVENIEVQQVSGDFLENVCNQGVEAVLSKEDNLWRKAALNTVGLDNDIEFIVGELTPKTLAQVRSNITRWNLPATTVMLANDYWSDIIGNSEFHSFFDPVTRYDLVLTGSIGTIFGMEIITDAFRQPNQKVMEAGEIFVVASPENHGSFTDRGGIVPTPVEGAVTGTSNRGWFMEEFFSLALVNPRSVSVAKRLV